MKNVITKLALHRETIRALVDSDLATVVGGADDSCVAFTREISGCRAVNGDTQKPPEK